MAYEDRYQEFEQYIASGEPGVEERARNWSMDNSEITPLHQSRNQTPKQSRNQILRAENFVVREFMSNFVNIILLNVIHKY